MSDTAADSADEPTHVLSHDLDDLAAIVERLITQTRAQTEVLDRLVDDSGDTAPSPADESDEPGEGGEGRDTAQEASAKSDRASVFIPALGGEAYVTELAALSDWVDHLLLPVYGREISTARPWCEKWHEHPEAVARLHALWLAWQQLTDVEAGLCGPGTWHRDHLDHTLAQLRAPDGPFAACTASPTRPNHRLLPGPGPGPGAATAEAVR